MDPEGLVRAVNSYVFKQWKQASSHVAPWGEFEVIDIIQSPQFQRWHAANPGGTIDQYYQHLCQVQAYHQSPQYQLQVLHDEIQSLELEIETLRDENEELREEIDDKYDKISYLQGLSTSFIIISLILLVLSIVLFTELKSSHPKK